MRPVTAPVPIPVTCAGRPTTGAGFVVPWANVQLADGGVDFRSQHQTKVQRCWLEGRCQLCGKQIWPPPLVFFGGPRQVAALTFDEPPMHPQCARYASQVCPMVAGRMDHYRTGDTVTAGARGATCSTPGCDCGGWVRTPGLNVGEGGDPAHDWYAVYASNFALGVATGRPDRVQAGVIDPADVLVVRQISSPGSGLMWKRVDDWQSIGGGGARPI
ncbi:hypothetical protein [Mycolicibacterium canariasense]|uniref:hypothetical protein n=1 Tax=Mycolicibacterium canariasense TaxID=228230 RepID=UPI000A151C14|nr:hypothetical protein [Mycolicibacterium canariasense]MCV7208364.1 hypothetical protein [Mycolicibacterium canariasense]ORV13551.1 hypothetical protein AWB94_04840 [Mycolicibacterium canariasense]